MATGRIRVGGLKGRRDLEEGKHRKSAKILANVFTHDVSMSKPSDGMEHLTNSIPTFYTRTWMISENPKSMSSLALSSLSNLVRIKAT